MDPLSPAFTTDLIIFPVEEEVESFHMPAYHSSPQISLHTEEVVNLY